MSAVCRERLAPAVRRASILSTNAETLAIFLSMLAGGPLWLFVYIAVVLNAVYGALYLDQKSRFAQAAAALSS